MKPIILAVLALLAGSRTALAELTVQQQHQARQLADVSVQITDLGESACCGMRTPGVFTAISWNVPSNTLLPVPPRISPKIWRCWTVKR